MGSSRAVAIKVKKRKGLIEGGLRCLEDLSSCVVITLLSVCQEFYVSGAGWNDVGVKERPVNVFSYVLKRRGTRGGGVKIFFRRSQIWRRLTVNGD